MAAMTAPTVRSFQGMRPAPATARAPLQAAKVGGGPALGGRLGALGEAGSRVGAPEGREA